MLLISNKISINKNTLVLSGCFVVWLFCWLHCLCIQQNHKTTKQQNHNIKHWYFSLPHGSGDWGASFTYKGLVTKTNSHGWNFMKFHPNSTTNSTTYIILSFNTLQQRGGIMELYLKKKYFFYEKSSLVFDRKEDCKSLVFSLQ